MSVKGFYVSGVVRRYDYESLENRPNDNGLSEAAKAAILQLAEKVAYVDANGQTYYQDLYDAFYGNFVNVTNTLTGCYSSNTATTTQQGAAYTATITANPGYTLTGATVSITMGGTSVTGAYSNGTINIPNVTGDLVITVAAVTAVSSISAVFTQGSYDIYTTDSLDTLKQYLVVTAHYSDSTTATIPSSDYTLTGTLAYGTSTITVSYGGKTATFTVTVNSWDTAWTSAQGSALSNGFVTAFSSTVSLSGSYMVLTPTSNSMSNIYKDPDFKPTSGVYEVIANWSTLPAGNGHYFNAPKIRVIAQGTELKWKITGSSSTIFQSLTANKDFTLRIAWTASSAVVSVDGIVIHEASSLNYDATRFLLACEASSNALKLKAIRLKEVA